MKPITNTVSISDMRRMREDGMTYKEIAHALGISMNTVSRYIGSRRDGYKDANKAVGERLKDTFGDRVEAYLDAHKVVEVVKDRTPRYSPEPALERLKTLTKTIVLAGSLCNFHVDLVAKEITLKDGTVDGLLTPETLNDFISDLQALARAIR